MRKERTSDVGVLPKMQLAESGVGGGCDKKGKANQEGYTCSRDTGDLGGNRF